MKTIFAICISLSILVSTAHSEWVAVGPFAGSVGQILIDPAHSNNLLLASSNGVYKSTNAGNSWQMLATFQELTTYHTLKIAQDPKTPQHLVAGGFPMFESTNRGETWSMLADVPDYDFNLRDQLVEEIEFNPVNTQNIYAVYDWGISKSTDGGKSWNPGFPLDKFVSEGKQIEIDPKNPSTLYALLDPSFVHKSTDSGKTWARYGNGLDTPYHQSLLLDKVSTNILFVSGGSGVFRSQDSAQSWKKVYDLEVFQLAADPRNHLHVLGFLLSATKRGFIETTNGGDTWTFHATSFSGRVIVFDPQLANVLYASDGRIFKSTDSGRTWINTGSRGFNELAASQIVGHRGHPGRLIINAGALYRTDDFARTWQRLLAPRFWFITGDPLNPDQLFGVRQFPGYAMKLYASKDAGLTWIQKGSMPFGPGTFSIDPKNSQIFYTSVGLQISKSTDQGGSWQLLPKHFESSDFNSLMVSPANSNVVYVLNDHLLYRSANGGRSWTALKNARDLWMARIHPVNANFLLACGFRGGGGFVIKKSMDGGRNWKAQYESSSASCRFLQFDPAGQEAAYLATNEGLMVSSDSGNTWGFFDSEGTGMPDLYSFLPRPWLTPDYFASLQFGGFLQYSRNESALAPVIEGLSAGGVLQNQELQIFGKNFGSTQGNGFVMMGTKKITAVKSWSDGRITLNVPADAATARVIVTTAGGASNSQLVAVLSDSAPINPSSGHAGDSITFALPFPPFDLPIVMFGGVVSPAVQVLSSGVVVASAPPHAGGAVPITMLNGSEVGTFTYR